MIRRPPRSTLSSSSAASDVYKRQSTQSTGETTVLKMEQPEDQEVAEMDELIQKQRSQGQLLVMINTMETSLVLQRDRYGEQAEQVLALGEKLVREYNAVAMEALRADQWQDVSELLKKAYVMTEPDTFFPDSDTRLRLRAITHNNLGCFHKRRGKLSMSLKHLEKAARMEETTPDPDNPAGTHLNLCAVLSMLHDHDSALEHAQTALELILARDKREGEGAKPSKQVWGDWEAVLAARVSPAATSRSRAARNCLNKALYDASKDACTSHGVTLDSCILPDVLCPLPPKGTLKATAGVVAGDSESYTTFGLLFDCVIHKIHNGFCAVSSHTTDLEPAAEVMDLAGLDLSYVVSASVRLGRNLPSYPFSVTLTPTQREELTAKIVEATGDRAPEELGQGGKLHEDLQAAAGLVTLLQPPGGEMEAAGAAADWPNHRKLCAAHDSVTVLVNGVEHAVFCARSPDNLWTAFTQAVEASNKVESALAESWARSDHLGFLSVTPESLGSIMRASLELKIPCLASHEELHYLTEALAVGHAATRQEGVLEIWNLETLGKSETEQLQTVLRAAGCMIEAEKRLSATDSVEVPNAVVRGVCPSAEESNSTRRGTMLAVAYHNLGVEFEHLNRWGEAIEAYSMGVQLAQARLGAESDVTKAIRSSLTGARKARKLKPMNHNTKVPGTARPWVEHRRTPRATRSPKPARMQGSLTARRHGHDKHSSRMGMAYGRATRTKTKAEVSFPALSQRHIAQERAYPFTREEWDSMHWDHAAIGNLASNPHEKHKFQPPQPHPSLATHYNMQKVVETGFTPAPPPRLPLGTLYRPARRLPQSAPQQASPQQTEADEQIVPSPP
eukprot:TRINITY_DN2503_c0_g1_i3.p1 TRINITY_DN2503_c0_g1~~TRINITY_DN2503_c0_g1_i3.p1  ORF type:complete len:847 (+),score=219.73 TRINITY_DN2503_c0_g1_i3:98-2638(+)